MMAGPTTDYAETCTVNCLTNNVANANCTAVDAAAGRFKATFPASAFGTGATGIPSDRTGSYVFTFEAYYFQQLSTDVTGVSVRKPFAANPEFVAKALTGSPTPRRVVASKCNSCHVDLGFHSNRSRKGASYCATCHNPNLDNSGRMRFLETAAATASARSGTRSWSTSRSRSSARGTAVRRAALRGGPFVVGADYRQEPYRP